MNEESLMECMNGSVKLSRSVSDDCCLVPDSVTHSLAYFTQSFKDAQFTDTGNYYNLQKQFRFQRLLET